MSNVINNLCYELLRTNAFKQITKHLIHEKRYYEV